MQTWADSVNKDSSDRVEKGSKLSGSTECE